MFRTISNMLPQDKDLPKRAHTLAVLQGFLDDTIYDLFQHEFHEERTDGGEYIPMAKRAPSVRYGILQTVVADSVSFLFAEGRFPAIDAGENNETDEETLESIIKDTGLNAVMIDAAMRGSIGSIAVWVRVLANRLFFKPLPTAFLTPTFKADAPDTLESVEELYKVKGAALLEAGYAIDDKDLGTDFWFRRVWNDKKEIWYKPIKVDGKKRPNVEDTGAGKTTAHNLGFVPMIWMRNLPGGDDIDGACTFKAAINNSIEINYQLSQSGRGLKYSSSPTLVLNTDQMQPANQQIVGDALVVPTDGDAKLLEIKGGAAEAVLAYCDGLRQMALESVGGSRADADKLSAATSGRAMEMMCQALINLADKLRSSYGEYGLLRLLRMISEISRKVKLLDSTGKAVPQISDSVSISLNWPRWFAPTADDRQADALAVTTLKAGGVISTETAVRAVAADYDIEDIEAEKAALKTETDAAQEAQVALKSAGPAPQNKG